MLVGGDYYARIEAREVIANLAKAAGLPAMIAAMRADFDDPDEFVRNTSSRAFAVVASALGIPAVMPFLRAVCRSKKSWEARQTGYRIIQRMAELTGVAVLPHLNALVMYVGPGLMDDKQQIVAAAANAVAALAEAAAPFGIESFDPVLKPLWEGIHKQRGKVLTAALRAIGNIIPLMEAQFANHYTRQVMPILVREVRALPYPVGRRCCC